jgi:glycosyltransferase involved in cell wall biosynthesis
MAGPGIRYFHLARALARELEVTLAVPPGSTLESGPDFDVVLCDPGGQAVAEAARRATAVLVPAVWFARVKPLLPSSLPVVVDGYDPYVAETLFLGGDTGELQRALAEAYLAGDFFLCASERQRDWWLGVLESHGRLNRYTFGEDSALRRLIDVVPFGLPAVPFPDAQPELPGIGPDDRVLLWGGGLWDWLDPLTAVRAMPLVADRRPEAKLLFPGTRHPNPDVPPMRKAAEAEELARDLGLLDRQVFFGDWVPWETWVGYLRRADVGLSLHPDTIETRLAFRSRVLDYVWAGLPAVVTRGDATSELVETYGLGAVVDFGDEGAVAEGILRLLDAPPGAFEEGFERARRDLAWERAARPLIAFCREPRIAPDRLALGERLGSPFYLDRIARLRTLVEGYERGRFVRFMRWAGRLRRRVLGRQ